MYKGTKFLYSSSFPLYCFTSFARSLEVSFSDSPIPPPSLIEPLTTFFLKEKELLTLKSLYQSTSLSESDFVCLVCLDVP